MRWIAATMMLLMLPACVGWPGERQAEASACRIVVTDFGTTRIGAITADRVAIYLDGNGSVNIERLTAKQIDENVGGYGSVKTVYSESGGSE